MSSRLNNWMIRIIKKFLYSAKVFFIFLYSVKKSLIENAKETFLWASGCCFRKLDLRGLILENYIIGSYPASRNNTGIVISPIIYRL